MRGTIIMWSGEKGVVTAAGQRHDFDINVWQGASAPATNMTVELAVSDGRLTAVSPVDEAQIAREKLQAATGKGAEMAKAVFSNVGKDVAIAYGVFLIAALFLSVISAGGMFNISITLADLLSGNPFAMLGGGSGRGVFLVLLATATVAVPYFWKHKFAPLAFLVPLLFTLWGFWPLYQQHRQEQQAMEAMGEFARAFGQMAEQMTGTSGGVFSNLGIGAWILFAAVLYLAFKGVVRFLGRG